MSDLTKIPPLPAFSSPGGAVREKMLGKFHYQTLPNGTVKILDGWASANIIKVHIPQLAGVENAPGDCYVSFHRKGAKQLQAMFAAWEAAGLLHLVKTWAGSFVPRLIRGSQTNLSNHAYGSAFDINAAWNGLGHSPATGEGTVIPLVKIANEHGFFWGGHYQNRKDAMHFELAVLDVFPRVPPRLNEQDIKFDTPNKSSAAGNVSHNSVAIPATMSDTNLADESNGGGASDGAASTQQVAENITNVNNGDKNVPDNFVPENKTVNAPPPSGMMAKATAWLAGLGLGLPSLGAAFESIKNYSADGFNLREGLQVGGEIFKFVFPYAIWIGIAFVVFWGLKELLKQISVLVKVWVSGRADMHNVEIKPFVNYRTGDWKNAPVETNRQPLSIIENNQSS